MRVSGSPRPEALASGRAVGFLRQCAPAHRRPGSRALQIEAPPEAGRRVVSSAGRCSLRSACWRHAPHQNGEESSHDRPPRPCHSRKWIAAAGPAGLGILEVAGWSRRARATVDRVGDRQPELLARRPSVVGSFAGASQPFAVLGHETVTNLDRQPDLQRLRSAVFWKCRAFRLGQHGVQWVGACGAGTWHPDDVVAGTGGCGGRPSDAPARGAKNPQANAEGLVA